MVCALRAQTRNVNFVQTEFIVVLYLVTNNGLRKNTKFCVQSNIVKPRCKAYSVPDIIYSREGAVTCFPRNSGSGTVFCRRFPCSSAVFFFWLWQVVLILFVRMCVYAYIYKRNLAVICWMYDMRTRC